MRTALSTIVALLAVLLGIPVLLAWGVRTTVLTSAPWQDALRQARVYDRLYEELLPELIGTTQQEHESFSRIPLSTDDFVDIVRAAVPQAFVQEHAERMLAIAFDVLTQRTSADALTYTIPLHDVQRRVPIAVQEKLVEKLDALPACTDALLREYEARKSLEDVLPPCIPEGTNVRALVTTALPAEQIAADIPASLDIAHELRALQSDGGRSGMDVLRRVQEGARQVLLVHVVLTVLLVVLVMGAGALQLPRARRAWQWVGVTAFLVGAGALSVARWSETLPAQVRSAGEGSETFVDILQPALEAVVVHVATRAQLLGLIVASTGVALFVLAYAVRHKPVDAPK